MTASAEIKKILKDASDAGRKILTEPVAKEILRLSAIPVPRFSVISEMDDAVLTASRLGFPVALKIVSPDIVHKSEANGVAIGIKDIAELEERLSCMILNVADHNPMASIEGFLIEEMAPKGVEVIVGAVRDEQFGTVLMFGAGGVAVELMKDVSFRLGPVEREDALGMISEVKGFPLLTGYRGDSVKDVEAIADVIVKLSMIMEEADGLKEIEINPLMVFDRGALAVDARAVLN